MFGLPEQTINSLLEFFSSQPDILQVRVYGSRALGTEKPASDIDLAIWTTGEKDLSAKIKSALEELPTPYLFDVTDYKTISHLPLKEHIDRASKLLYEKKNTIV